MSCPVKRNIFLNNVLGQRAIIKFISCNSLKLIGVVMWNSRPKFLILNALRNVVLSPNRFAQKSLIVVSNGFASSQPRLCTSSQHRAPYNKSKQTNLAVEFVGDINRKKLIKFLDNFALKDFREVCQQHNLNGSFRFWATFINLNIRSFQSSSFMRLSRVSGNIVCTHIVCQTNSTLR